MGENPALCHILVHQYSCQGKRLPLVMMCYFIQSDLGIQDTLRVVSIGYDPDDETKTEIEISNAVKSLEDQLYKIATTTIAKRKGI